MPTPMQDPNRAALLRCDACRDAIRYYQEIWDRLPYPDQYSASHPRAQLVSEFKKLERAASIYAAELQAMDHGFVHRLAEVDVDWRDKLEGTLALIAGPDSPYAAEAGYRRRDCTCRDGSRAGSEGVH